MKRMIGNNASPIIVVSLSVDWKDERKVDLEIEITSHNIKLLAPRP